ncbi:hypothetical protein SCUP234_08976 [Seiridium cupressi]
MAEPQPAQISSRGPQAPKDQSRGGRTFALGLVFLCLGRHGDHPAAAAQLLPGCPNPQGLQQERDLGVGENSALHPDPLRGGGTLRLWQCSAEIKSQSQHAGQMSQHSELVRGETEKRDKRKRAVPQYFQLPLAARPKFFVTEECHSWMDVPNSGGHVVASRFSNITRSDAARADMSPQGARRLAQRALAARFGTRHEALIGVGMSVGIDMGHDQRPWYLSEVAFRYSSIPRKQAKCREAQ